MLAEQQTEWIINNNLINKGWHIDSNDNLKNVYFQKPKLEKQRKLLNGRKPDYILYQSRTDRPIAIIEAKKGGSGLKKALKDGTEYAEALNVPLLFAMNGAYCETRFIPNNKELILNGEEVRELLREVEVLKFLQENTNEAWTIPQEVKVSRGELISQFRNLNAILRSEGLRAGIERFSEFANILFLKLLSENEHKSHWDAIKTLPDDMLISTINGAIIAEIESKYGGDVFTPISIKNPQTLRHIIDAIDPLVLSAIGTDVKGDAFEYFLEKTTSTENDLGEYFTPRNIIQTIINLVHPKFKETIYDPFCGTGGFLTEAFNYIKENNIIESEEDLERLKNNTLYGREITTTARIAKMNMIFHGDGHSGIQQINTLTNPDYMEKNKAKKFDVIVTNMPFSQIITRKIKKNGNREIENNISPLYYNGIAKNSGDSVCVLHCLRALKEGGRMALVVPEGFLFRKNIANVRKFLLSKAKLQTVISLPQGAFLPYTGVKTDILYFTDAHKPNNQKNYWFFDANNIGVTLDNHKRKIKGDNDLKKIESSDIKKIDKNPEFEENMLEIGFEIIDLEKVKNNHFNLVGGTYRELLATSKYKMIALGDICTLIRGVTFSKNDYIDSEREGYIGIVTTRAAQKSGINYERLYYIQTSTVKKEKHLKNNDILISLANSLPLVGRTTFVTNLNKNLSFGVFMGAIRANTSEALPFYILSVLNSNVARNFFKENARTTTNISNLNFSILKEMKIPLPSIEEQQHIVEDLDGYQQIIESQKDIIKLFQNKIDDKINSLWKEDVPKKLDVQDDHNLGQMVKQVLSYRVKKK